MKDHHPTPSASTRYLARRDRRKHLLLPPVAAAERRSVPLADLMPAPSIPGAYNNGLRRDQLLGDFSTVTVTVGPWEYADLTDTIVFHWGDQWTQNFPVTNTSGAQLLTITGSDIAGNPLGNGDHYTGEGTHEVWYEVKPRGGEPQPSAVQLVVVKTARPGGEDPNPGTPVNDNLEASTALPNPVEQDTPTVTFSVRPWINIVAGDRLVLVLAGVRFDFPAVTNTTTTQVLTLTADQVGVTGGGPRTPVTYEIVDIVGNRSRYAPYLLLDIFLETGDRLEMIELFDEARLPIDGAIDPSMTDGFARVPRYAGWLPGESVTVFFDGEGSDGQPHDRTLGPLSWNIVDYYLDFPLPGDYLLLLEGGIVRVHYENDKRPPGVAYRRQYVIDALPESKLPPVTVLGERNGELPLDAINGDYVSIVVPDSEALVDFSRITLTMTGNNGSVPVSEDEIHNVGQGEGHKPYTFSWLKTRVAKLLDHQATFSYTIRTFDGASRDDEPRKYRPKAISESEPHELLIRQTGAPGQLSPPIVHDLVNGAISPTLPTLTLTIPAGSASVTGAKVTTYVAGLTSENRTDQIFDDGETLIVDFPGWPASNDGAKAKAWYVIGTQTSKEAPFLVGVPEPLSIDESRLTLTDTTVVQGHQATGGTAPYIYSSKDTSVAMVVDDRLGTIRAITDGDTNIVVNDSATPAGAVSYPVTVTGTIDFYIDPSTLKLTDTLPVQGHQATGGTKPYTYSSDNPNVIRVTNAVTGTVQAVTDGSANVTVYDSAKPPHSGSYPVTAVGTIAFYIDPSTLTLTNTTPVQGHQASGGVKPYVYSSSNPNVVRVNDPVNGIVQAVTDGNVTITVHDSATPQQNSGSYLITAVGTIPLTIDTTVLVLSDLMPTQGHQASGGVPPYTYTSNNVSVVLVTDATRGIVQAVTDGTAVITVRDSATPSGSATYTVSAEPWLYSLTTFASYTYEGWNRGPGASTGYFGILKPLGKPGLYMDTGGFGDYSGDVVDRTFTTKPGATYGLSLLMTGTTNHPASITTSQNGVALHRDVAITNGYQPLQEIGFIATSTTTKIIIHNGQKSGVGNDFGLTDILIRRIA